MCILTIHAYIYTNDVGNNPETFRQYEAFEMGAIPILINRSRHKVTIYDDDNYNTSMSSSSNSNINGNNVCSNSYSSDDGEACVYNTDSSSIASDDVYIDYSDYDFLSHPSWKDYPGPVLYSWVELQVYLTTVYTSSEYSSIVSTLQYETQRWYREFKMDMKKKIVDMIDKRGM